MAYLPFSFKDFRTYLAVTNPISICELETLCYQNYASIRDVPDGRYDDLWLYGVGGIREVVEQKYLPCIEIVLSKTPREDNDSSERQGEK